MKVGELLDQLSKIADHGGRELEIEINGERVDQLTIALQHPLASVLTNSGMTEYRKDKRRNTIIAIATNGRELPDLPVRELDERHW